VWRELGRIADDGSQTRDAFRDGFLHNVAQLVSHVLLDAGQVPINRSSCLTRRSIWAERTLLCRCRDYHERTRCVSATARLGPAVFEILEKAAPTGLVGTAEPLLVFDRRDGINS
jgi:hypothetical protein